MAVILQFGAGNIGRGFMGQLFWEAGYTVVFVEAREDLVNLLNARRSYPLRILDAYARQTIDFSIGPVSAIHAEDQEQVAQAFAKAEVVGTAVGVKNLPAIAFPIALGIRKRRARQKGPVDIYLCENAKDAAESLKSAVFKYLIKEERSWAEEFVGFVGTSVARMVPSPETFPEPRDPLLVVADAYHEFPYDARASRAAPPPIVGAKPVQNFFAEFSRKLHTHNLGHAALAYLGYLRGHEYIYEGFSDPFVSEVFERSLDETSQALLERFPQDLDPEEHQKIREDIRIRFGNPLLKDTVHRVARDPLRKLSPSERLIGSARLCLEEGVFPEYIACVCAAALLYDWNGDSEALELQRMVANEGLSSVLARVCEIDSESLLGKRIGEWYARLRDRRKEC